jgi:O-antigen/teichoic acid export membrane protein
VVGSAGILLLRRQGYMARPGAARLQRGLLVGFGFWAMIGTLINSVYFMVDSLLVSMLRTIEEIGFYNIAGSWMSLIAYIAPISSVVMYPYFSGLGRQRKSDALQSSIKYTLSSVLPVGFLMSAFSVPIISIFYGPSFMPAAGALGILSFVSIPFVLSPLFMSYIYGIGKPKVHTVAITVVFLLGVALSYMMINSYGIWGAALAMLATRIVEIGLLAALIAAASDFRLEWGNVLKPLIASLVIYIMASWLQVSGIIQLVAYGIALLAVYLAIMLAIGGIEKRDMDVIYGWLRSALKR